MELAARTRATIHQSKRFELKEIKEIVGEVSRATLFRRLARNRADGTITCNAIGPRLYMITEQGVERAQILTEIQYMKARTTDLLRKLSEPGKTKPTQAPQTATIPAEST